MDRNAPVHQLGDITELPPGERIGRYRITARLGEGGMGIVYRALAPDGSEVALKFVRSELSDNQVLLKRFQREAATARRIEHPHLVPVLETGEHHGVPFMVQTYIRGGSLHEKLERKGTLALEETVVLCLEVGKGLMALHAQRLVHRDLKPANILLDENEHAYISDFGLAKDPDASLLTSPGSTVGSADYMAPELIRAEEVTAATDIYALACVVFECLAGRAPFSDRQGIQILWAHLQSEPPDPCAERDDVPAGLGWAVTRALEKDAARRPQTAMAYARMVQVAAGVPPLSPGRE
jgi:serine/threonine-protein kinase